MHLLSSLVIFLAYVVMQPSSSCQSGARTQRCRQHPQQVPPVEARSFRPQILFPSSPPVTKTCGGSRYCLARQAGCLYCSNDVAMTNHKPCLQTAAHIARKCNIGSPLPNASCSMDVEDRSYYLLSKLVCPCRHGLATASLPPTQEHVQRCSFYHHERGMWPRCRAGGAHVADGLERVALAAGQHGQHVSLHVHLDLLPRLQLLAQAHVCLARVQLPAAGQRQAPRPSLSLLSVNSRCTRLPRLGVKPSGNPAN